MKDNDFDGLVLEIWSQLGGQAREETSEVVAEVARAVREAGGTFVLVIPPPIHHRDRPGMFEWADFRRLVDNVDYFSLMTYDYSSLQRPGPNAPAGWVRRCVELLDPGDENRGKILLGLNFYGLRFTAEGGGHLLGRDLLQVLLHRRLQSTATSTQNSFF